MPINHYPSPDIPQSLWWIHPQLQQPPPMDPTPIKPSDHHRHRHTASLNFNLNRHDDDDDEELLFDANAPDRDDAQSQTLTDSAGGQSMKEAMFEKPLTPSDVGKLNRLVIPKQHAEKHFPLGGGGTGDSGGLLLSFEDESGKCWRFRYSYWNSSQSYVLTKGWSRFVKEKNLKAGDIVGFHRSAEPDQQLFIDWKAKTDGSGLGRVADPVFEPVQMVRLFGVNIFQVPGSGGSCGVKRSREMELLAFEWSKKSRIVGAS